MKEKIINWLISKDKEMMYKLLSNMEKMRNVLFNDYKNNIEDIFLKSYSLNYKIKSMEAVLDKKDRESLNILYKFNAENIRKIDELKRTIQTWEVGKSVEVSEV